MAEINDLYREAEKLKDEGKLDESIAKLQEILTRDESHVLAHLALAVVCGRRRNGQGAHARRPSLTAF